MSDIEDFRTSQVEQGELWEELRVEHLFFHVVSGMIHRGMLKEMTPMGWAVYCVIKAHANIATGLSRPSIARIAELIGVSHDTVQRAMKVLEKMGILQKDVSGKTNQYILKELVPITMPSPSKEVFGYGEVPYIPLQFSGFIDELKAFAKTGNIPGNKNITVNVTFNVQNITQGDSGNVTMNVQSVQVSGDTPADPNTVIERTDMQKIVTKLKNL